MGGGLAIVDTGLDIPPSREAWEALFAGPLAGRDDHPHHLHPFPSRSSRPRRLALPSASECRCG
jgi:hypothetical protein